MTQRDPSEPSRLLKDLESIRTLLDEQGEDEAQGEDAQLDIPLLQDVIVDAAGLDLSVPLIPVEPGLQDHLPDQRPGTTPPGAPKPNPFLPYDQLARLAEERVQLDRLMAGHIPPAPRSPEYSHPYARRPGPHTGAREVRMEARLHAEAQLILQEVLDELMPMIEDEMRRRLQHKVEQLVREQLR